MTHTSRVATALTTLLLLLAVVAPALAGTSTVTEATAVEPHYMTFGDFSQAQLGADGDALQSLSMARMMAVAFDEHLGTRWRSVHGSYYNCATNLSFQDSQDVCALHRAGVLMPIPQLESGQWVWDDTKGFTRYELAEYTYKILNFINSHNRDSGWVTDPWRMGTDSPLDGYSMDDRLASASYTIGSRTNPKAAYWDVEDDIANGFITESKAQYVSWMSLPGIRVFEPCDGDPADNAFLYQSGYNAQSLKACGMSSATNDEAKLSLLRLFAIAQAKPTEHTTAWFMQLPGDFWPYLWADPSTWGVDGGPLWDVEFNDGIRTHDVKDCAGIEGSGPQASDYASYSGSYTQVPQSYWGHTGYWPHDVDSVGRHFPANVDIHNWVGWDGGGDYVSASSYVGGTRGDCR